MEHFNIPSLDLPGRASAAMPPMFSKTGVLYKLLTGVLTSALSIYNTGQVGSLTALLNRMFPDTTAHLSIYLADVLPAGNWLVVYAEVASFANQHVLVWDETEDDTNYYDLNMPIPTAELVHVVNDEEQILLPTTAFEVHIPYTLWGRRNEIMAVVSRYRLASRTATPVIIV